MGTENRVEAITYSLFDVMNGDPWLPPEFGICRISDASNVFRSTRATRGVLFALTKIQRPSSSPFVCESAV